MTKAYYILTLIVILGVAGIGYGQTYPNRQVTTNSADQSETVIAVSPLNSTYLIGAWNDYQGDSIFKAGYGISTDGGSTWSKGLLEASSVTQTGYIYGANQSVAFDQYGTVFQCFVATDGPNSTNNTIALARKTFPNGTWLYTKVSSKIVDGDKPWITVDNTGISGRDGNIYIGWTDIQTGFQYTTYTTYVARSTDHGVSFSTPFALESIVGAENEPAMSLMPVDSGSSFSAVGTYLQFTTPAVDPRNGDVYVMWGNVTGGNGVFKTRKSTDGGSTWQTSVSGPSFTDPYYVVGNTARVLAMPSFTVAPTGDLCFAYTTSEAEGARVKFALSTNGGSSWSTQIIGNVGTGTRKQFMPALTVDATGRITVAFLHSGNPTATDAKVQGYLTTSDNYGTNWSTESISNADSYPQYGRATYEYQGIASIASNHQVFYLWSDFRNQNADAFYVSLVDKTISISQGWNMLGISDTIACGYPFESYYTYEQPCAYSGAVADVFSYAGSYVDQYYLKNGVGYFVKLGSSSSLIHRGVPAYSMDIPVVPGWNLIGSISFPIGTNTVTSTPSGLIRSYFFDYTNHYNTVSTLQPGKGHWVKIGGNGGTLHLSATLPPSGGTPPEPSAVPPSDPTQIPTAPALVVPTNNYFPTPVPTTLTWNASSNGAADHYDIHIRNYNGTDIRDLTSSDITTTIEDFWYYTTYYWKVRGVTALGIVGDWSTERSFVTQTNPGPCECCDRSGGPDDPQMDSVDPCGGDSKTAISGDAQFTIPEVPVAYSLGQNYPNPFNPVTEIKYGLPEDVTVLLKVYNVLGQEVLTLVNEFQSAGYKTVSFEANTLPSGVYFYRLQAGTFTELKKMLLAK